MRVIAAVLSALAILTTSATAIDCEQFLRTHGFLSRAQFQCHFSRYNNEMIAQARDCMQRLSAARAKENLRAGMALFDRHERERGHDRLCRDVLHDFPMAVRR